MTLYQRLQALLYWRNRIKITLGMPKTTKSCCLIGFGIVLFLLSAAHVGVSIWLISLTTSAVFVDFSLACGLLYLIQSLLFLIHSLLSTFGGTDVGRWQYSIIWCKVRVIFGVIVSFITAVISLVTLEDYSEQRKICDFHVELSCSKLVHVGLAILALLEGLAGLILSISACCNTCSCCYENPYPDGYVLQSPVGDTHTTTDIPYTPLVNPPEHIPC